jgi:hypothetical protein
LYFFSPSFPGTSSLSRSFQFWSEDTNETLQTVNRGLQFLVRSVHLMPLKFNLIPSEHYNPVCILKFIVVIRPTFCMHSLSSSSFPHHRGLHFRVLTTLLDPNQLQTFSSCKYPN